MNFKALKWTNVNYTSSCIAFTSKENQRWVKVPVKDESGKSRLVTVRFLKDGDYCVILTSFHFERVPYVVFCIS